MGHTVFAGSVVDSFTVEILGVIEGWSQAGDVILARLGGGPLERTGVMQGMSGSPVFVDGELIGAVMSTWPFTTEPIAGIRPISELRRLADDLGTGDGKDWQSGPNPLDLFASPPDGMVEVGEMGSGLAWSSEGFLPAVRSGMERELGAPVMAGVRGAGATAGQTDRPLEGGDAMAVLLVDGDARLFATGTVTERIGDTVLGFGHPFMGLGHVSLPLARAEVVALLPRWEVSTKMAAATERVGTLFLDRRAGVAGRLGVDPDMLPVTVTTRGGSNLEGRSYSFEVARNVGLTPNLVTWTVQNSLLGGRQTSDDQVVFFRETLRLADGQEVVSEAALTGPKLVESLATEVRLPLTLLERNPERAVRLEEVQVELELRPGREQAEVGRIQVVDPVLEPSGAVTVRVELLPVRAPAEWVELELTLPPALRSGRYRLHVGDGAQSFLEEIARSAPRYRRLGPEQVVDAFSRREPANHLVAVVYAAPRSAVVGGVEWEEIPPSVLSILRRSHAAPEAQPVAATPVARATLPTQWMLRGTSYLELEGPADGPSPSSDDGGKSSP